MGIMSDIFGCESRKKDSLDWSKIEIGTRVIFRDARWIDEVEPESGIFGGLSDSGRCAKVTSVGVVRWLDRNGVVLLDTFKD